MDSRNNLHQYKALFCKNIALQSRQVGTNLCQVYLDLKNYQIFTPLICIAFVYLVKQLAFDRFKGSQFKLDIPVMFNVPSLYSAYPSLLDLTCLQWYYFDFAEDMPKEQRDIVGWNSGIQGDNMSEGILSNIVGKPGCDFEANRTQYTMNIPFFQKPKTTINEEIYEQVLYLNSKPFLRGADIEDLYLIPDGAITFNNATENWINYTVQINDLRLWEYHRSNGITKIRFKNQLNPNKTGQMMFVAEGQLSLIDLISRAFLHYLNPNVWLVSGIQYMPLLNEDQSFILKLINVTGATLYPFALSLLLPVFLYAIVLEKEERLLQMMKMNGLKMFDYWILTFVFQGLMIILTFGLFFLFGYSVLQLSLFTQTNSTLLFLTFAGWGLSLNSLAIFFQVFINKARTATIIGYLLSVWISIMAVTINLGVYPDPYEIPVYLQTLPPVAFARLIYVLSIQCSQSGCIQELYPISNEIAGCLFFLYLGAIIFAILGVWLHEIVPQDYGVQKSCTLCHPFAKKYQAELQEFGSEDVNIQVNEAEEDQDAREERTKIYAMQEDQYKNYPLVVKDIRKVYDQIGGRPKNIAVKNFSLKIEQGEIFGLLGPNGAGKTTLISILTGLYPSTSGQCWVAGYNVESEIQNVQMNIGVCPQFDLLWPELTVEEHLLFYARLKGVSQQIEKSRVQLSLREVKLSQFSNYQTKQLSGGMKRRLSIAIALVGDPKIIFLDEPSTGLDPENRRQLWNILVESRGKRAMVLTTHSMEEADVLCNRIGKKFVDKILYFQGIVAQGVLRCIGPQLRLKTLYGGGYHLYISCHRERYLKQHEVEPINMEKYHKTLLDYVRRVLPFSVLVQQFNGSFIFTIPQENIKVSEIFPLFEDQRELLKIADWGISQSSLEDVFMRIVENL